jgi:hypothetical protein
MYRDISTYQENLRDRTVTGVFWIVLCARPLEPLWNLPEVRRQAAADGDAAREADALRVVTKARQDHFRLVTWCDLNLSNLSNLSHRSTFQRRRYEAHLSQPVASICQQQNYCIYRWTWKLVNGFHTVCINFVDDSSVQVRLGRPFVLQVVVPPLESCWQSVVAKNKGILRETVVEFGKNFLVSVFPVEWIWV